jgi:hypothetical protein
MERALIPDSVHDRGASPLYCAGLSVFRRVGPIIGGRTEGGFSDAQRFVRNMRRSAQATWHPICSYSKREVCDEWNGS